MHPARVWTISRYVDSDGNTCRPDDFEATPLWSSKEPSDEDRLRRRRTELEAIKRREKAELARRESLRVAPLEPLRRKG